MRFAIPTTDGKLAMHFGHCKEFTVIDTSAGIITGHQMLVPPPHEPGVLPKWIGEEVAANMIIAGGMGKRAQDLFDSYGVKVLVGAQAKDPRELVTDYFTDTLVTGANVCDH